MQGRRHPNTLLALTAGILLLTFAVAASLYLTGGSDVIGNLVTLGQKNRPAGKRRSVTTGTPLNWRTLEFRPRATTAESSLIGGLTTGDFDGDDNEEILLLPLSGGGLLIEVDGEKTAVGLSGSEFVHPWGWDIDGDGADEVFGLVDQAELESTFVPGNTSRMSETVFYTLEGNPYARLDGFALAGRNPTMDFNNDGIDDLVLCSGPGQYNVFGERGALLYSYTTITPRLTAVFADVNGDLRVELVDFDTTLMKFIAYSSDGSEAGTFGYDGKGMFIKACGAIDQLPTMLLFSTGFISFPEGANTAINFPPRTSIEKRTYEICTRGNFLDDGKLNSALSVASSVGYGGIMIVDDNGDVEYHEELARSEVSILGLAAHGMDFLVARTPDRLLIYP